MNGRLRATRYVTERTPPWLIQTITERLDTFDFDETFAFYDEFRKKTQHANDHALLAANDRYYLLTMLCGRYDAFHPFIFSRCRVVEAEPDNCLDLWARYHYKSTLITFAGVLQETLVDPELSAAIFSFNKKIAKTFLAQIKRECEVNANLRTIFRDVLYWNPKVESPKWSEEEGLIFKRVGNQKESTISAWGLVDSMPTGMHFGLLDYDDIIERKHVTNPEMVKKATEAWEMSDNLGIGEKTRKWHVGTRYSFGDTYGQILERRLLKPRIIAATHNGRLDGNPIYFSKKHWEHVKKTQRSTVASQMLQNPVAGTEGTFFLSDFVGFEVFPQRMNVYIMGDPSRGNKQRDSDRTAIAVVGVDAQFNFYFLDGVRHKMRLDERWEYLFMLRQKWADMPGVMSLRVGWEQYGMQADIDYFNIEMRKLKNEKERFVIEELNWPREGGHSKNDRIQRLQPFFAKHRFYLPHIIHQEGGPHWWKVNVPENRIDYSPALKRSDDGKTIFNTRQYTRTQQAFIALGQPWCVPETLRRIDEDKNVYDVTHALIQEMLYHPLAPKDDLVDCVSRVFDMQPSAPMLLEQSTPEEINYADA